MLEGGAVAVGDSLELVQRPHPSWPLQRVGDLLYSQAEVAAGEWPQWRGDAAELEELLQLPELAVTEYKEELYKIQAAAA
eukprot:SAG22_NODE_3929_length_1464_cov_3.465201_3_plen_80_part_00